MPRRSPGRKWIPARAVPRRGDGFERRPGRRPRRRSAPMTGADGSGPAGPGDAPAGDAPRALRAPGEVARRHAMLRRPHVAPLAAYVAGLRDRGEVPDVDPLDGGIAARLLLLLEKPGPKTSPARGGSGFVSADNDDPTAAAAWRFAREAGIERRDRIVWNVAPVVERHDPLHDGGAACRARGAGRLSRPAADAAGGRHRRSAGGAGPPRAGGAGARRVRLRAPLPSGEGGEPGPVARDPRSVGRGAGGPGCR